MTEPKGSRGFVQEAKRLLAAQIPLIHVQTFEEARAFELICEAADAQGRHVLAWSTSRGVFNPAAKKAHATKPTHLGMAQPMADLLAALQAFEQSLDREQSAADGMTFVLFDPYVYLSDRNANPIYRRRLRDLVSDIRIKGWKANCIIISPILDIPPELQHDITVIDLPLPSRPEIRTYVRHFVDQIKHSQSITVMENIEDLVERFAEAAVGLTQLEIENALSYAVIDDLKLDDRDIEQIFRQKRQTVRKSGLLDFIDTDGISIDNLGGLDRLKRWLSRHRATMTQTGRDFGLAPPKGLLLTGVPGCGKSWSAKCAAASWKLPLIRLDMGRVYSMMVGASEENMRHAIQIAEAVAPCILWIDEIEKGLTRPSEHIGDSGVSMRVLGTFLTWMQEKTSPVFVFATANETEHLPPELLRRGRFDGVFFVDLPNFAERREIADIHLQRIGRSEDIPELDTLARISGGGSGEEGMTGAEIAAWVDDALLLAYDRAAQGQDPHLRISDFEASMQEMTTLARMRPADLTRMRKWAGDHARPASTAD